MNAKGAWLDANHTGCIAGQLEQWPLLGLLQWLNGENRTAMVRLGTGLDAGVIFVSRGNLYWCQWGKLRGEFALFALLRMVRGPFMLIQRDPPQAMPNVKTETELLLTSCAHTLVPKRPLAA